VTSFCFARCTPAECAARDAQHFNALAFAANQTGVAQGLEVLGQRGFGNRLLTDIDEFRADLRAVGLGHPHVNRNPHRIGQRMENALHRELFHRRVNERFHKINVRTLASLSIVRKF
jgi:hypothetical protein